LEAAEAMVEKFKTQTDITSVIYMKAVRKMLSSITVFPMNLMNVEKLKQFRALVPLSFEL